MGCVTGIVTAFRALSSEAKTAANPQITAATSVYPDEQTISTPESDFAFGQQRRLMHRLQHLKNI
jgi:hypothetical protein